MKNTVLAVGGAGSRPLHTFTSIFSPRGWQVRFYKSPFPAITMTFGVNVWLKGTVAQDFFVSFFTSNCPSWSYKTMPDAFFKNLLLSYSSLKMFPRHPGHRGNAIFQCSKQRWNANCWCPGHPVIESWVLKLWTVEKIPSVWGTGEMRNAGVRDTSEIRNDTGM